jgi:hypothetical protein
MTRRALALVALSAACGGGAATSTPTTTTPDTTSTGTGDPPAGDPLDRFDPVPPEVDSAKISVSLPAVPGFELPTAPDGARSVKELRVAGTKLRGQQIKVVGYVTWIYDCVAAVAVPGEKKSQVQKRIESDPTLCERPKLHLADHKGDPANTSIWVVDVPRAPTAAEKKRLPKAELAAWPAVPKVAVGDKVAITGVFDVRSPHGEVNSDGLVVYASLEHVEDK